MYLEDIKKMGNNPISIIRSESGEITKGETPASILVDIYNCGGWVIHSIDGKMYMSKGEVLIIGG